MARLPNTTRFLVREALNYVTLNFNQANANLKKIDIFDEQTNLANFDSNQVTDFKTALRNQAKSDVRDGVKMLRWMFTELGITTIPTAYTDAQVDAIDENIRTHDE